MAKHLFEFECPCCGERIEIDTRSGKTRAADPTKDRKNDFDRLVAEQGRASERLDSVFDEARKDQQGHARKLDALFDDAAQKAKENPDEKPRNPFDLD